MNPQENQDWSWALVALVILSPVVPSCITMCGWAHHALYQGTQAMGVRKMELNFNLPSSVSFVPLWLSPDNWCIICGSFWTVHQRKAISKTEAMVKFVLYPDLSFYLCSEHFQNTSFHLQWLIIPTNTIISFMNILTQVSISQEAWMGCF